MINGLVELDPTTGLTARQAEVLGLIYRTICREGRRPTFREIGAAIGCASPTAVMCHLKALHRKGFVDYTQGRGKVTSADCFHLLRLPDGSEFLGFRAVTSRD